MRPRFRGDGGGSSSTYLKRIRLCWQAAIVAQRATILALVVPWCAHGARYPHIGPRRAAGKLQPSEGENTRALRRRLGAAAKASG